MGLGKLYECNVTVFRQLGRWKSPVTPGDDLIMEMSLVSFDERLGFATMTGKAYVGGRVSDHVILGMLY